MDTKYVSKAGTPGKIIVARAKPGSDLLKTLREIVDEEKIQAGVILSVVGLLGKARLRNCKRLPEDYPITDENRTYLSIMRPLEILSASGNVTKFEEAPLVHAHLTLSSVEGEKITVIGGHLIEGCIVFGFAEIMIMVLDDLEMKKRYDEETRTPQLFA